MARRPLARPQVKTLVQTGQLTFLNGGWSMVRARARARVLLRRAVRRWRPHHPPLPRAPRLQHDEANPTFVDMLDNTAVGQRAIAGNFGVAALPTVTW